MRRAPIVIGATVAGLAGVLGYHTAAPQSVLGAGAFSSRGGTASVGTSSKAGSASSGTGTGSSSAGSGTSSTTSGSTGTGSTGTGSTGTGSTGTGSTGTGSTGTGSTGTGSTGTGSTGTGSTGTGSTGTGSTGTGSTSAGSSASSSGSSSSGSRTATGTSVNYFYGTLSVQVTATGKKITNVTIASINDGGNYRSQSIDQYSIPQLEQQVMQAQSGNIQGVSGATYTSQGFAQSLQSALTQLGI